jgi:hypothetical protein
VTNPPWLNVAPPSGVLEPGGAAQIICSLNAAATNLPVGAYSAAVVLSDNTFGAEESVPFLFLVGQLVQNGGFETGGLTDWTLAGDAREDFVSTNSIAVFSGTYGMDLGETGGLAYLSQVIPTVPGMTYLISLWLDSPNGLTPNEFSVSWGGNALYDCTNLPAIGWTNLQFTVWATNSCTELQIGAQDDQSFLGLDDVSVSAAPPTLDSVSPASGPVAGGTTVTITGSGFESYAMISFGSLAAVPVTLCGPTNLTVVAPAALNAGPVNVALTNADGQSAVLTNGFIFAGTPAIIWSHPPPLTYGTALGPLQLNASANVPGTFRYVPPAGTVLNAGSNLLAVAFTPNDSVDYFGATNYVGLVVSPAPLSATAGNATRPYGVDNPVLTGVLTGLQNGDNITANYACAATSSSPAGTYLVVPSLADPDGRLTNYQVAIVDGMLTILPPVPSVLQIAALTPNSFTFSWAATPGVAYQVQSNLSLIPGNWFNLGGLIITSNATASMTDSFPCANCFYRVLLVPQ